MSSPRRPTAPRRLSLRVAGRPTSSSWTSACHTWTASMPPPESRPPNPASRGFSSSPPSARIATCTTRCARAPADFSSRTRSAANLSTRCESSPPASRSSRPQTRVGSSSSSYVVGCRPPPSGPPPEVAELPPRELEITRRVAQGLSNAAIAEQLVLSIGTVKSHVAHVLDKLELRDRVQIVVLAYECGLVQPGERPAATPED